MKSLIQTLPDGPVDIVGDVHGEFDALKALMSNLGYDSTGVHPGGRKLVFVGDLVDRGPDSVSVVRTVNDLVQSGHAFCVLGNHDLNLLLHGRKFENGWFYGEEFVDEDGIVAPQRLARENERQVILDFFATLPLGLEREDLRVVHACWDDRMIEQTRGRDCVLELYQQFTEQIDREHVSPELDDIDRRLQHQNRNPVKVLTSGPEERSATEELAGGRWRYEKRIHWWLDYEGPFCVFGHYGIPEQRIEGVQRESKHAFCVDYKVGGRWKERREGLVAGFRTRLAAFRFPERSVVFDEDPC